MFVSTLRRSELHCSSSRVVPSVCMKSSTISRNFQDLRGISMGNQTRDSTTTTAFFEKLESTNIWMGPMLGASRNDRYSPPALWEMTAPPVWELRSTGWCRNDIRPATKWRNYYHHLRRPRQVNWIEKQRKIGCMFFAKKPGPSTWPLRHPDVRVARDRAGANHRSRKTLERLMYHFTRYNK